MEAASSYFVIMLKTLESLQNLDINISDNNLEWSDKINIMAEFRKSFTSN